MKKIYLLLGLGLLLLYSCQKDEIMTEDDEKEFDYSSFEQKPFYSIPENLQNYFFKKTQLKANENPRNFGRFGYVNKEVPVRVARINEEEISYTFALTKVDSLKSDKYYVDNLVITEYTDKGYKATIIRYTPTHKGQFSAQISSFSGTIEFFMENGDKLGDIHLENGVQKSKKLRRQKGFSTNCTYTWESTICTAESSSNKETCLMTFSESCTTVYLSDYYGREDSGGTGGGGGQELDYTGGGGGSVTTSPIPEEEVDAAAAFEEKIDDSNLDPCLQKIIEELKKDQ